jgi:hypothetical protein
MNDIKKNKISKKISKKNQIIGPDLPISSEPIPIKPIDIKATEDLKRLNEKYSNTSTDQQPGSGPINENHTVDQNEITQILEMLNGQYKLARKKDLPQLSQVAFRMAETGYQKKGTSSFGFLEDKPHYCIGIAILGIAIDILLDFQKNKKIKTTNNEPNITEVVKTKETKDDDDFISKKMGGQIPN